MTAAFVVAAIASTALTAYGSYQQGKQAKQAAEYQAKVQSVNQKIAANNADAQAQLVRQKYRQLRGSQLAHGSKSGLTIDSFSDVMSESESGEKQDVGNVLYGAKTQLMGMELQKGLLISQGKNAFSSGRLSAWGSVASGAGQMASAYPTISGQN